MVTEKNSSTKRSMASSRMLIATKCNRSEWGPGHPRVAGPHIPDD